MLALVHPFTPSPAEISHRAPSAGPSTSRTRQPSRSKQQQSALPSTSSSLPLSSQNSHGSGGSGSGTHASVAPVPTIQNHQHQQHPQPPPSHHGQRSHIPSTKPSSDIPLTNPTPSSPLAVHLSSALHSTEQHDEELPNPQATPAVDIHTYPSQDLLRLLASLLTQIAATNDKMNTPSPPPGANCDSPHLRSPVWHTLTTASRTALATPSATISFHARNVPTITLEAYLFRILKYCPTTNEVFLSLLVYFDRMAKLSVDLNMAEEGSRTGGKPFVIDSYNVHRLVIAGVTVASKFFSDVFYTNSRYAKVGGLPQAELNQLELQFLLLNDFRLVIPKTEMQSYADQLVAFAESGEQPRSFAHTATDSTLALGHDSSVHLQRAAAMGAVDAYAGPIPHPALSTSTVRYRPQREDETDTETETETENGDTETEGGWTTDDEPTIRPPNSNNSEDSRSICSTDTEDDADEQDTMDVAEKTPERVAADVERTPDAVLGSGRRGDHLMDSP